jgi:hypothetical protein
MIQSRRVDITQYPKESKDSGPVRMVCGKIDSLEAF